ncbi:MAG: glycosyltransferase, partial [Clostridia bacterium]
MKKLNIGIFIDIFYPMIDGVVKVADNYARRLSKVANVTVFTCKNFVKGEYTDDFPYKVVRCKSIPIGYASYVLATPNQDSAFKKQLRESNLDIVHIHSPFTMGNAGLAYAKRHKIPCISTFHSQYRKDIDSITHNDLLTNIALAFIMPIFNQCTVCYTMNNFCKNILQSYGCKNKIEIVRNASDLIVLKTKEEYIQLANEKHSLQENDFVMLYVGRLYALKNIFLILEACKLLHESGITFKFYYVGTGIEESKLKKLITKYNLTTCVFLLGSITNQEELLSLYARANIFVFPSNYDTDGIVKIEAASVNTPTICLKNSAAASFIVDNYNGFLVENSASNLCAKII